MQRHKLTAAHEHLTSALSEPFISLAGLFFFLYIFSLVTFQPWIIESVLFDAFFPLSHCDISNQCLDVLCFKFQTEVQFYSAIIFGLSTLVLGLVLGSIPVHTWSWT